MRNTLATLCLLGALVAAAAPGSAQNLPAVTSPEPSQGFSLPDPLTGGLQYALTASENVRVGYYGANKNIYVSSLSGDLGYSSGSVGRPTSLVYSGGYLYTAGQNGNRSIPSSSTFQNLMFSQGLRAGRWSLGLTDQLRYLPQASTGGLSGIAGLGDVGIGLPVGSLDGQDILTAYGQRLNNMTDVTAQRSLTGSTSVAASGGYMLQRYLDASGGLDTDGLNGSGTLTHRLNALSSVSGSYDYSRFTYSGSDFQVTSQSIQAQYSRQINRKLYVSVGAGPMKTSNNIPGLGDASWNVGASASAIYSGQNSSLAIAFNRGVRSGSGVVRGAISTGLTGVYNYRIDRATSVSAEAGYTQNDSFRAANVPFTIRTLLASLQGRRSLSRDFSAFLSYSLQKQLLNGTIASVNAYSGLNQTVGFGITYSPSLIHLSHK
jgi:hypothetical protein